MCTKKIQRVPCDEFSTFSICKSPETWRGHLRQQLYALSPAFAKIASHITADDFLVNNIVWSTRVLDCRTLCLHLISLHATLKANIKRSVRVVLPWSCICKPCSHTPID